MFLCIGIGFFFALPNLYGDDPALQISGTHGIEIDQAKADEITNLLSSKDLNVSSVELEKGQLLIRFDNTDVQIAAKELVSSTLGSNYIVALNLAPATPNWMRSLGMHPLKLGLDLRGGVHFLMEVDMEEAMKKMRAQLTNDFRTELRNHNIRLTGARAEGDHVTVEFREKSIRDEGKKLLESRHPDFIFENEERDGKYFLRATMTPAKLSDMRTNAVDQNINPSY